MQTPITVKSNHRKNILLKKNLDYAYTKLCYPYFIRLYNRIKIIPIETYTKVEIKNNENGAKMVVGCVSSGFICLQKGLQLLLFYCVLNPLEMMQSTTN